MRAIAVALSLVAAGYATHARGEAADAGLTLGARLGYGIPMGDGGKPGGQSIALSKYTSGSVPFIVEAGYRFTREISAGAYFQYAYASVGEICETIGASSQVPGVTCTSSSAYVLRYGLQGASRFPVQGMVPWVGLGFGTESAHLTTTVNVPGYGSQKVTVKPSSDLIGEVNLQGGVEWPLSQGFTIGPFATLTFAKYTKAVFSPSQPGQPDSIPSSDQAWHEWLILGVKGTFDL